MEVKDLLAAIDRRDAETARKALEAGVDPNGRDSLGMPALWRAVGQGDRDIVGLLLDHGARVDAATAQGNTPLMLAAARGDRNMAIQLLEAGADTGARNRWELGPEDWAVWPANAPEMRALLAGGRG